MHGRFVAAFRRGLEAEKAALRCDGSAYEVALENGAALSELTQTDAHFYSFRLPRPSDRVSVGLHCSLRDPSGLEWPIRLEQLDGSTLVIRSETPLTLSPGGYRLIFVPWFLYDGMAEALEALPHPDSALRAFGKLPAERCSLPPAQLESPLNDRQIEAVQRGLEEQLLVLWGPPGTGKTTTLAELIANLSQLGRRILIASTTHAALTQVLARLSRIRTLETAFSTGQIVRLGGENESFGCSLSETLRKTQAEAQLSWERCRIRRERLQPERDRLEPLLERCAQAAASAHQLDLFGEAPSPVTAAELAGLLGAERGGALAGREASVQYAVLARRRRRLEALEQGLRVRVRQARAVLLNGQQQAVDQAQIVLTTLANLAVSPLLKEQSFDSVVLEEAGMALLPALYLAAGRSRHQTILVGDPQQLPAILTSRDAYARQTLSRSIFEVLGTDAARVMLDVQYRMHPKIGALVSELFYASGLLHQAPDSEQLAARPPFPGQALVLVDQPGRCLVEPGDFSRFNPASAAIAVDLAARARAAGSSVAVIAPYRKQVQRIAEQLSLRQVEAECATVHRFQGHERDVVILDIVDAAPLEPGALLTRSGAANLLNVSLSRARGKLILIADLEYVRGRARGSVLLRVLEAAARSGLVISP